MALKIDKAITHVEIVPASEHNVSRINSIQDNHKDIRQMSKAPTFALTR